MEIISGASWVIIGAAATLFIFNENTAIIGLLVLSIADSVAAIVGIKLGKTQLFSKSLEGSMAFFAAATTRPVPDHPQEWHCGCSWRGYPPGLPWHFPGDTGQAHGPLY